MDERTKRPDGSRTWTGALALGAALAAGCAAAPVRPLAPYADATFTIVLATDAKGVTCPAKVEPVGTPCPDGAADCVYVDRNNFVTFQVRGQTVPPTPVDITFDPFKKAQLAPLGDGKLRLKVDAPAGPAPKTYTFNVGSGTCPVLDPRIIVQ